MLPTRRARSPPLWLCNRLLLVLLLGTLPLQSLAVLFIPATNTGNGHSLPMRQHTQRQLVIQQQHPLPLSSLVPRPEQVSSATIAEEPSSLATFLAQPADQLPFRDTDGSAVASLRQFLTTTSSTVAPTADTLVATWMANQLTHNTPPAEYRGQLRLLLGWLEQRRARQPYSTQWLTGEPAAELLTLFVSDVIELGPQAVALPSVVHSIREDYEILEQRMQQAGVTMPLTQDDYIHYCIRKHPRY